MVVVGPTVCDCISSHLAVVDLLYDREGCILLKTIGELLIQFPFF